MKLILPGSPEYDEYERSGRVPPRAVVEVVTFNSLAHTSKRRRNWHATESARPTPRKRAKKTSAEWSQFLQEKRARRRAERA